MATPALVLVLAVLTSFVLTCVMWKFLLRAWGQPATNTTTNAVAVTLLMSVCANLDQVLTDIGPLVNLLPLVAAGLFGRYRYRLTFWRGVAVAFVVSLWLFIAQLAMGAATLILYTISPGLAVVPIALLLLVVLGKWWSARSLRQRMEAVR